MATYLTELNGNKYAVLEPNFLAARRTGQVRAQLPLDATDFATKPAQNGTFLKYDMGNGVVKEPGASNPEQVKGLMLHFSVEKEYDTLRPGLNNFAVWRQVANNAPGTPYPRLFQPHLGDTFTTDAIKIHNSTGQDVTAWNALVVGHVYQVDRYGFIDGASGNQSSVTGVRVKLIAKTTLPDGGYAGKFEVVNVV